MNWNQLSGCIAMLMGLGLAAPLACAGENPPGGQLLQDFSSPPAYSFLSWEGKPKAVDGALLVQVPDDRGGCGYMLIPPLDFSQAADRTPVLTVTVGAANKLAALGVFIKDRDETTHAYVFNLTGVAAGATATITANDGASLKEPSNVSDRPKPSPYERRSVTGLGSSVPTSPRIRETTAARASKLRLKTAGTRKIVNSVDTISPPTTTLPRPR